MLSELMKENKRHMFRIIIALCAAFITNHWYSFSLGWWLPLATFFVMLTDIGSAVYQGILRYLLLLLTVVLISCVFSLPQTMHARVYDITIGATIGIMVNAIVFPDPVDTYFRQTMARILQSYNIYFEEISQLLLDKKMLVADNATLYADNVTLNTSNAKLHADNVTLNTSHAKLHADNITLNENNATLKADNAKLNVERALLSLPLWVYETGFDVTLQKSYQYFVMKVSEMGELLFSMHHLARFHFSKQLMDIIADPLQQSVQKSKHFFTAFMHILHLQKLEMPVLDFYPEIEIMEQNFKEAIRIPTEILDVSKDSVYLIEFIYNMRELQDILVKMAQALSIFSQG